MAVIGTTVRASDILRAIGSRIRALSPELVPASQPLGVAAQSDAAINRSYFVGFGEDGGTGDRVRPGTHIAIQQAFIVELGHTIRAQAKNGDGASVWGVALDDREAVRFALCNHADDALKLCDGSLEYRGASTAILAGGAYLVTTLRWAVTYTQSLEVTA
jgi:hypothetical protein